MTLKRQRRYAEASDQWRTVLSDANRAIRLVVAGESAKYLEHHECDRAVWPTFGDLMSPTA